MSPAPPPALVERANTPSTDVQTDYTQTAPVGDSNAFNDPFAGAVGTDTYEDPGLAAPSSTATDRTRYEGLPPGDSAARSVPARMRPPGTGR